MRLTILKLKLFGWLFPYSFELSELCFLTFHFLCLGCLVFFPPKMISQTLFTSGAHFAESATPFLVLGLQVFLLFIDKWRHISFCNCCFCFFPLCSGQIGIKDFRLHTETTKVNLALSLRKIKIKMEYKHANCITTFQKSNSQCYTTS